VSADQTQGELLLINWTGTLLSNRLFKKYLGMFRVASVIGNYDFQFPKGKKIDGNVSENRTVKKRKASITDFVLRHTNFHDEFKVDSAAVIQSPPSHKPYLRMVNVPDVVRRICYHLSDSAIPHSFGFGNFFGFSKLFAPLTFTLRLNTLS
jgi:hypothetical protein